MPFLRKFAGPTRPNRGKNSVTKPEEIIPGHYYKLNGSTEIVVLTQAGVGKELTFLYAYAKEPNMALEHNCMDLAVIPYSSGMFNQQNYILRHNRPPLSPNELEALKKKLAK